MTESANCNHDCEHCSQNEGCSQKPYNKADFLIAPNSSSHISKHIGIVSGKGGVGKSLVTALLAIQMQTKVKNCAILDADITGPSIPQMFGLTERLQGDENGIIPAETLTGIEVVSTNLLMENPEEPVVWRGPVISGLVKQFYSEVNWKDVDYMFIDLPPGTGDVPLTVFQSLPLDGIIIVTTPQDLVSMVVKKAVHMAEKMDVKIIGIIENMSYVICPHCSQKVELFGQKRSQNLAEQLGLTMLAQLPIDPQLAQSCDEGQIEEAKRPDLSAAIAAIEKL